MAEVAPGSRHQVPLRSGADTFQLEGVVGDRYEVRERLATSTSGQTFRARDRRGARDVEIRIATASGSTLLLDEAQRIARNPHPGVPAIFEVGSHTGKPYVVAEHVSGTTLAARMAQAGQTGMALDEALAILFELADALTTVHRLQIAHDVLAPDRVILGPEGRVVLAELGVIRAERELPADSPYASRATSPHARDCYSLGVIALEALSGTVPVPWEPVVTQIARLPETYAQLRAAIHSLVAVVDGREPPDLDDIASMLRSARAALRPLSVLIAEPDRGARKLLSLVLRQNSPGATLRFSSDARSLLSLAAAQVPDLVFFDPQLPGLNVRELCTNLRAIRGGARMTICATRALAIAGTKLGALEIDNIDITPASPRPVLAGKLREMIRQRTQLETPNRPARKVTGPQVVARGPTIYQPPADVVEPAPASELAPGVTVAERYVIEHRLGEGGMGGVFAVRHVALGKRFALKALHPALMKSIEARQRFLEEAKLASQISHPNVVSVVDFGQAPEHGMFLVMELLSGDTLGRFAGRMSLRKTCETLGQVADALDVLHKNGIVHGDIKADNVMMVEEQASLRRRTIARLIDFGLAHRMSSISEKDPIAGTPEYMAPERARGGPPSVATDIYALGIVAYELLAGCVPFQGRIEDVLAAHATTELPPIVPQRGEPVDEAVLALVARATNKDPGQRHPTVSAFRYELNAVMNMLGMTRRTQARRSPAASQLFAESRVAQAVIAATGEIELANEAFRALSLDLGQLVFDRTTLVEVIASVQTSGSPVTKIAHDATRSWLVIVTPVESSAHILLGTPPIAGC